MHFKLAFFEISNWFANQNTNPKPNQNFFGSTCLSTHEYRRKYSRFHSESSFNKDFENVIKNCV